MKKISLITLLCFCLIKITAQSYQQQYIQDEQIRLANVNDTEIEIDNFISQNIDTYDFTEVTNNVNRIKDENGQPLTGSAYQNALSSAKKERLRNFYFEKNPEKLKLYSARILQQCVNGGFEADGGSTYGYSFTSNHIAAPAWSLFNNNPGTAITPGPTAKATLVDNSINDPIVGIPRVNNGTHAIRLGNSIMGSQGDYYFVTRMRRTFVVNENSISFAFALVLENGGSSHVTGNTNPYYQVRLFNSNNQAIFSRDVMANPSNPLFTNSNGILFTNWLCENINTARFMGQTVTLEITLSDCGQGGHWGYGYFDDFCGFNCTSPSFNPGITLNPLPSGCPKFPLPVSGNITLPSNASFTNVTLQVLDISNNIIATKIINSAPGGFFSTNLDYSDFYPSGPNNNIQFNIRAILNYGISGSPQTPIIANNTNPPGPDVSFKNCPTPCYEELIFQQDQTINSSVNYQASCCITSYSIINPDNTVNFKAGYIISLQPGFYVSGYNTGLFHAYIGRCEENNFNSRIQQNSIGNKIESLDSDVKISPNPTSAYINIDAGKEKVVSWDLYDRSGKSVLRGNSEQIDVQGLLKGSYILKINLEKRYISKAVIIK